MHTSHTVDKPPNKTGRTRIALPIGGEMELMMRVVCLLAALLSVLSSTSITYATGWSVVNARWRPDVSPNTPQQAWERLIWTEGWSAPDQFYPKHWHPAGSVHVILRNTSGKADSIKLVEVDGKPLDQVKTTQTQAGRVVWYRVESPQLPITDEDFSIQKDVPAGQWAECSIRLREPPQDKIKLTFADSAGQKLDVPVGIREPYARLESVAFSPQIDRMYVYVRSVYGETPKGSLSLDGIDLTRKTAWTPGPAGSGLVLAGVKLEKPLEYGTHHLLQVSLPHPALGGKPIQHEGRVYANHGIIVEQLVQPIRAWDSYFGIGLYGTLTDEKVKSAKEHGVNTYYNTRNEILDKYEMSTVPGYWTIEERQRKPGGFGLLYHQNFDEPDAGDWHEGEALPFQDRIGVQAELNVLPWQRRQRKGDPRGLNLILVDGTFKPANWYVYGQIPDVFCSDPYVPLGGRQMDYVWNVMECVKDASTPRPTVAVLWGCALSHEGKRFGNFAPTPEEGRMMVFYSLGCGVSGYCFFIDLTKEEGEGQFIGLMDFPKLWEEVGRANHDATALAPYLSIGCPIGKAETQGWVWTRSLMCGPDDVVVIAVNTNHHIAYETKSELAINIPTKNAVIEAALPPGFKDCTIREVVDGKLVPAAGKVEKGKVKLTLDELATARAFVVSRRGAK